MSDLYTDMQDLAVDLSSSFGRKAGIKIHHASPVLDVVEGKRIGSETVEAVDGVVVSVSAKLMSDVRMVGNSSSMTTDKEVLIPSVKNGLPIEIKAADKLEFDGAIWAILKLDPCKPADTMIFYDIWVRK